MTSTRSIFPVMDTVILLVLNHGVDPVRCFRGPLHFLGSPPMNLLDATLDGDRLNWPASECRCRSGSTGSEARWERRRENPSLTEAAGWSGCAGVKLRQQMAFARSRQGSGDEGRGALWAGSLCGSD